MRHVHKNEIPDTRGIRDGIRSASIFSGFVFSFFFFIIVFVLSFSSTSVCSHFSHIKELLCCRMWPGADTIQTVEVCIYTACTLLADYVLMVGRRVEHAAQHETFCATPAV